MRSMSLIRQAQWAATVIGDPGFSLSGATEAQLEALVRRAELYAGTNRARRIDLFPAKDTVIAKTLRWLLDVGEPVTKRVFMNAYHRYSTRSSASRSSFAHNVGPYTRGAGAVLATYDGEVLNKRTGKPRMRTKLRFDPASGRVTMPYQVPMTIDMVKWIGPSIEEWLHTMIEPDLDRAYSLLETRLLAVDEDPEESALARRWLERVKAEIDRRVP